MPRRRTFNNGTKKSKYCASKERHPTLPQFVRSDDKSNRCCACGVMKSNTVQLLIEKTSNELFCFTCMNECNPSEMWWGIDDSTISDIRNDTCHHNTLDDIPFHTLGEGQTWEDVIGQWQNNMQLVPSKGRCMRLTISIYL